jgi:endonuclease YncB( thermonuclease family)
MGLGMKTWRSAIASCLAALAVACSGPATQDLKAGETGKALEARYGDRLSLETIKGEPPLDVRLTGIEAPRQGWPLAKEARAGLERLTIGRQVRLFYGGASRYKGRDGAEAATAHVYAKTEGGRWIYVQQALLADGLVRVHSRKDNFARVGALLAAEAQARAARRGIWADDFYRVRDAEADLALLTEEAAGCGRRRGAAEAPVKAEAPATAEPTALPIEAEGPPRTKDCFKLVEGRVRSVGDRGERLYLNFGDDVGKDFAAIVGGEALAEWSGGKDALLALDGKKLRVRGYLSGGDAPLLRLDHAAQVELID